MSIYNELRTRILRAYKEASNGFHPAEAAAKIVSADEALQGPFEDLAGQIDDQIAGRYASLPEYKTASGNTLLLLDADFEVLKTAVANAARADRAKIAQVVVDQSVAVSKAKAQQSADGDLVDQTGKLIEQARKDATAAGELPQPDGGSLDKLKPADVDALSKSIAESASPKEDAIAAEQLATIGGQIKPL